MTLHLYHECDRPGCMEKVEASPRMDRLRVRDAEEVPEGWLIKVGPVGAVWLTYCSPGCASLAHVPLRSST